jgi:hypothetical protein
VLDSFLLHCGLVGMVLDIFLVTTKTVSMSAICLKATPSQSQIKSQRKKKKDEFVLKSLHPWKSSFLFAFSCHFRSYWIVEKFK